MALLKDDRISLIYIEHKFGVCKPNHIRHPFYALEKPGRTSK